MNTLNRTCSLCSKHFYYPPGANHPGKYCSRDCRDKAITTIPDALCLTCGSPAHPPKGNGIRQRGKKYCSPECYAESLRGKPSARNTRVSLLCERCGALKEIKAYRVGEYRYCSRSCYSADRAENAVTPELERLRHSAEYREWRTAIFVRDDYTCQGCGQRGGTLHADHIKAFAHYPELRFDVSNGRTLCVPCHKDTPNFGFKAWRCVDAIGY